MNQLPLIHLLKTSNARPLKGLGIQALLSFCSCHINSIANLLVWIICAPLIVAEIYTPISMEARCLPFRPSAKYNAAPSDIISHVSP